MKALVLVTEDTINIQRLRVSKLLNLTLTKDNTALSLCTFHTILKDSVRCVLEEDEANLAESEKILHKRFIRKS